MNQLEYIPGIGGQSVQMDGPESFVGIAENLRSREWSYNLGYRDIVSATRPAREIDTTFHADYATADQLRRVADADVMAATPGIFLAQNEWRQRGYILASQPNDIHFGRLSTELKIALLDGAWWRLVSKSFMVEDIEPTYTTGTGKSVTTTNAANAPLHALAVDGESVQNGTPTPSNPVDIQVVKPVNGTFGISVNGTVTSIDLQGNVLASLPNGAKDVLTVDSAGHYVATINAKKLVFNGSTTPTLSGSSSTLDNWKIGTGTGTKDWKQSAGSATNLSPANTMTNSYPVVSGGFSYATGPGVSIWVDGYYLRTTKDQFADGAAVQAYLQANPVEVWYQLATTQTIDLGYIDMPNVFNNAVVSITAEVTPTITAEWQTSPDIYLDYPHDYPHDYMRTSYAESITPSVLTPSNVHFVIFGPAVNPYVIVGDNTYQVNVTVPAGGYLTVDGRDKTIVLTLADGTIQNVFSAGVRGSGQGGGNYVFEPVAPGEQSVSWDGSFGFDFGWYEEEGEPPWSQS